MKKIFQISYDPLPAQNLSSLDRTFKPQPSPRIVRARRQTSQPSSSSSASASAYPSAIAERERDRRPSFEVLMENRRIASQSAGHDYPSSRDAVTSKPPPALPSPSDPVRSFSGTPKHHLHHSSASHSDGSVLGRSSVPSASHSASQAASQAASQSKKNQRRSSRNSKNGSQSSGKNSFVVLGFEPEIARSKELKTLSLMKSLKEPASNLFILNNSI